ncbi:hypothetical protein ACFR9U_06640 [Halorientalis brevis]|uniref:DUF5667 domain-containing protein n=1 Tax=Halorientalis brevis TaxID=1126241 RepID=A0ABD6CBB4_9EURY|nr:hypothetical protein [Halorientalis brevis]
MRRTLSLLAAVLVVVGTLGAGTALGAVHSPLSETNDPAAVAANESNATVAPGERLAGVVGAQEAELDGEIDSRSFGLAVAGASSDEAKAALIAEKVNETQRELGNLTQQREQLREARQNGSISQGEYRARITELASRTENVERAANDTANASQGLPADLLESKGVNVTAIQTLGDQAKNLSGGEVADIARSIAGPQAADRGQPDDRGADKRPDERERGNASDSGQAGQSGGPNAPTASGQNGAGQPDGTATDQSEPRATATDDSGSSDRDRGGNAGGSSGSSDSAGAR